MDEKAAEGPPGEEQGPPGEVLRAQGEGGFTHACLCVHVDTGGWGEKYHVF